MATQRSSPYCLRSRIVRVSSSERKMHSAAHKIRPDSKKYKRVLGPHPIFSKKLPPFAKESGPPVNDLRRYVKTTEEEIAKFSKPFADRAVRFFNKKSGKKYELVHAGRTTSWPIWAGLGHHMNCKIKEKGQPDAPVVMLFAEFFEFFPRVPRVDICECVGTVKSLPAKPNDNHGCKYCNPGVIFHPALPGGFGINWTVERAIANGQRIN